MTTYTPSPELTKALEIAAKELADTRHEDGHAYALVSIARSLEMIAANMSAAAKPAPTTKAMPGSVAEDTAIEELLTSLIDQYEAGEARVHLRDTVRAWLPKNQPAPTPASEPTDDGIDDLIDGMTDRLRCEIGMTTRKGLREIVRAWLPKSQPAPVFAPTDADIDALMIRVAHEMDSGERSRIVFRQIFRQWQQEASA